MLDLNLKSFLDSIFSYLDRINVDASNFKMDHIAYRASSSDDYDDLKPEFLKMGQEIIESIVGGRRVGVYKLHHPITYKNYVIEGIELIS